MPKREDIKKIMIIGSGPIVIGQACEFDYSGSQACKALKEEGYEVILINSNPATIMTDPELADKTYIEPIYPEVIEKIIAKERPQAILPTVGGQTALNVTLELAKLGVLEKYSVELIGVNIESIKKAEDRDLFKKAMIKIGLEVPVSGLASTMDEALQILEEIKLPIIIRPAFTLGGAGGNIVYNREDFADLVKKGMDESPINQVLLEESIIGWKELELELIRDSNDNVIIICSIENFDPMGIHTGDSITVAPQQTLTDRQYEDLCDIGKRIMREVGIDSGGSNIQFALNPDDGRIMIIEMNPRVSRSSALASKATGFPIAKVSAKLAAGFTLDEIPYNAAGGTLASYDPSIDYVVVKAPRWDFEKFDDADKSLGTQMKSVGESMAIGRTFKEAFQKALRSLEINRAGFGADGNLKLTSYLDFLSDEERTIAFKKEFLSPGAERVFYIYQALKRGKPLEWLHGLTRIDPWFLNQLWELVNAENKFEKDFQTGGLNPARVQEMKEFGYSDRQLAYISNRGMLLELNRKGSLFQKKYSMALRQSENEIGRFRKEHGILPGFSVVDTCAGKVEAHTSYFYSTYGSVNESAPGKRKKIMILGSGPNRIGQGIEFDYCCCQASYALKEEGVESVMVNSNPETVSTDYDTSDRLYFEPLTLEDILHIHELEKPDGVIVQFGGQTPLRLAKALEENGVKIIGTSPDSIDRAEDRERFSAVVEKLNLKQPENGIAFTEEDAVKIADHIGYPVLVRPSYVLGGRSMAIIFDQPGLLNYIKTAVELSPEYPILVDDFLEDAVEVDVDAICDGDDVYVGAIMEHVEEAGIHSGDSACIIPPMTISRDMQANIAATTRLLAFELNVVGLLNIQFAIKDNELFVLEVNPRASRTVPFVSKTSGVPMAKIALKVMLGKKLKEMGFLETKEFSYVSVKEAVLPFNRFPGVDILLSPEMKSTGEVMGISYNFGESFYKAELAAGDRLPSNGTIFFSINDRSKGELLDEVRLLHFAGFKILATKGTAKFYNEHNIPCEMVYKVNEGRPNVVDRIKDMDIHLIVNTPIGKMTRDDAYFIRQAAIRYHVPVVTTISAAKAAIKGLLYVKEMGEFSVKPLQEYYSEVK
ncbi:MAG: carbamoyl-phosphate synthase large subunit [Spirochaetota bacterium]